MQERYFYLDDTQKALIGTGVTAAAGIGTALAQRGRKNVSDVENRCGKKPRKKGDARDKWEQCAYSNQPKANVEKDSEKKDENKTNDWLKKNKNILLIGGAILTVSIITFIIVKKRKK